MTPADLGPHVGAWRKRPVLVTGIPRIPAVENEETNRRVTERLAALRNSYDPKDTTDDEHRD